VEAIVDTPDGTRYVADLRKRDKGLGERYSQITRTLGHASKGGLQQTASINIEGIFRLMQSVPTKKAEPFKKWLARVGFERLQELENPELAIKRAVAIYKAKGYDDSWIDARIPNKAARLKLEDIWDKRGITQGVEYAVLTNAISEETFGINTEQHKEIKGLKSQGLRDNMTPMELTLTTLAEQATAQIAESRDAKGFIQNEDAAKSGGRIAGNAREDIEEKTGKKVVSPQNYLTEAQRKNNTQIGEGFEEVLERIAQAKSSKK